MIAEEMDALPYVIIADDAFLLKSDLLKPYPYCNLSLWHRIFNYRLSRGRRIVKNSLGILANRFQVFLVTVHLSPEM